MAHNRNPEINRLEGEIDAARKEASHTIQDIKTEADIEKERINAKVRDTLKQTGGKIKSAGSRSRDYLRRSKTQGQRHLQNSRKTGLYVGAGLMTAGLITGMAGILAKRRAGKTASIPSGPEDIADHLQEIEEEAKLDEQGQTVIKPVGFEEEYTR
ncbi:MAG: hypothetical protein R6U50_08955 [Desulfobacterales bacterium]